MSYAKARKHNRVERREVERMAAFNGGFFITREKRNRIIAAAVGFMVLVFVKGIVLGCLFSRSGDCAGEDF